MANHPSTHIDARGLGPVPVPAAERRAADHELADAIVVGRGHHGLDAGQREPDRTGSTFPAQGIGQGQQRLRHPVAFEHRYPALALEPPPEIGRERGRSRRHTGAAPPTRRPGRSRPAGGTWWARRRTWCPPPRHRAQASGSKRSKTVAEPPAANAPKSPAHNPCTWKSGSARISRSSGCQSQARRSASTPANSERWVWTAPLGSPVVPEV